MKDKQIEKVYVTWGEYNVMVREIADFYEDKNLEVIVGLSRGGLPMGVHLSNILKVPFIPLQWQTRDGEEQDVVGLLKIENKYDMDKVLFVDDICDSGKTIDQINSIVKGITWAVLINKIQGKVEYAAEDLFSDEWIVFPWEY